VEQIIGFVRRLDRGLIPAPALSERAGQQAVRSRARLSMTSLRTRLGTIPAMALYVAAGIAEPRARFAAWPRT
jgi:hypothetical protein